LNDDTNSIIDTNYLSLFLFNISITELNIKFKNKNKHNSSQNTNAIERIFTEFILIHPEYNKDASNKSLTHILNKDRQVYSLQDIYSLYTSGSNIIQFLAMSAEYMPNLPYESTLDVFYNNNNSSRFMPTSYRNLFKLSYVNDAFNNGGIFIFDPRLAYLIQTDRSDIWNISYYNTSNLNGIDMIDRIVILIFQKYASLKRYLYSKNRSYASDIYKKPYKDISNELRDINKPLDKSINYESNWIEWENIPYSDTFTFNNYIETYKTNIIKKVREHQNINTLKLDLLNEFDNFIIKKGIFPKSNKALISSIVDNNTNNSIDIDKIIDDICKIIDLKKYLLPEVQIAIDTVVFLRDYKKSNVHYKKEIIPIVKEFFTVLNSFDVTISSDNIAFIIEYIDGIPTDDTLKAHLKTYVSQQFNSKTSGGKRRNKKRTKKHSKRRNKKRTKRCTKRRNKKRTKRPTKRRNKKRTKKT